MNDPTPIRPTDERIAKADHLADDGKPTAEKPYVRANRLGTAWDRYCRDRDGKGNLLTDEQMVLTRRQIATGVAYLTAYESGLWEGHTASKHEMGVNSSYKGAPVHWIEARADLGKLHAKLSPRYLISLVQAVLIEGFSAEDWAGATERKANSGLPMLRIALDQMGGD